MWSERAKDILERIDPLLQGMGMKIIDMRIPSAEGNTLRIYMDRTEGDNPVSVDDCAEVSRVISDYLDTEDIFDFSYNLEISSPGIDRPVRRWEDLESCVGKYVRVKTRQRISGGKKFSGVLKDIDDENSRFSVDTGKKTIWIGRYNVKRMNLIWEGDNNGA